MAQVRIRHAGYKQHDINRGYPGLKIYNILSILIDKIPQLFFRAYFRFSPSPGLRKFPFQKIAVFYH